MPISFATRRSVTNTISTHIDLKYYLKTRGRIYIKNKSICVRFLFTITEFSSDQRSRNRSTEREIPRNSSKILAQRRFSARATLFKNWMFIMQLVWLDCVRSRALNGRFFIYFRVLTDQRVFLLQRQRDLFSSPMHLGSTPQLSFVVSFWLVTIVQHP